MISIYPTPGSHSSVSYPFLPVDNCKFSQLANYITRYTWSPILFRNATRQENNFLAARLIALDFDNTKEQVMTLSQAVDNVFAGMRHIIGTTRNHQLPKETSKDTYPPADRFRVILMLDKTVKSADDYAYTFTKSIRHYQSDSGAAGLSRLFFPCREIISVSDGDFEDFYQESPQDKEKRLAKAEIMRREALAYHAIGRLPPFVLQRMTMGVTHNRNSMLYPVIRYYAEMGYEQAQIEAIIMNSRTMIINKTDREFRRGIVSSIKSAIKHHGAGNG